MESDVKIIVHHASDQSRILDIGGAPFYTDVALQRLGYDVTCVDIDPKRFEGFILEKQLRVVACDFEESALPFAPESFDLVLLSEVFEHLRKDLIFSLEQVLTVLKPGGRLLLSTPNFFEFRRLKRLVRRGRTGDIFSEYKKLTAIGHMGHVREYTPVDVSDFLHRIGFEIDRMIYRGASGSLPVRTIKKIAPWLRDWFAILARKGRKVNE